MAEVELEIIEGPEAGRVLRAEVPVEVGREAGLAINDPLVSRRHARIATGPEGLTIEDLGSRNGTFLNGQPVHSASLIRMNDTVLLGVTVLSVRSSNASAHQASSVVHVPPAILAAPKMKAPAPETPELDALLDNRTKGMARTAPIAIFVVIVLALLVVLAQR